MEPVTGLLLLFMIGGAGLLARHSVRRRMPEVERLRWNAGTLWKGEGRKARCGQDARCLLDSSAARHEPGKWKPCVACGRSVVRDSYGGYALGVEGFVRDASGPLVSSLQSDGTHAPAIDVDYGLDWQPKRGRRGGRLIFRTGISDPLYRKAVLAFEAAGLGTGTERPASPKLPGVQGFRAMTMRSEASFDLEVAARVVGSRTLGHHHLYIEAHLDWPSYERLLGALAGCGLIEKAFHEAAVVHEMSLLRRGDPADVLDAPPPRHPSGPPPAPATEIASRVPRRGWPWPTRGVLPR